MREPIFNIGDRVYYNLPEGALGNVIDISYSYLTKRHKYYIAYGFGQGDWCYEEELTTEKVII